MKTKQTSENQMNNLSEFFIASVRENLESYLVNEYELSNSSTNEIYLIEFSFKNTLVTLNNQNYLEMKTENEQSFSTVLTTEDNLDISLSTLYDYLAVK